MPVTDLDALTGLSDTIRDVSDEKPRLCGICGVTPIGPERIACPECTKRTAWIAENDPYYWMEGRPKPVPPIDA